MKHLIIFTLTVYCLIFASQEKKLEGEYKMQYEEIFASQNGVIQFTDSIYERKLVNGHKVRGIIEFGKRDIILKDSNKGLIMKFFRMHMNKDTIYFQTTKIDDQPVKGNDISIYSGKLIKIK